MPISHPAHLFGGQALVGFWPDSRHKGAPGVICALLEAADRMTFSDIYIYIYILEWHLLKKSKHILLRSQASAALRLHHAA